MNNYKNYLKNLIDEKKEDLENYYKSQPRLDTEHKQKGFSEIYSIFSDAVNYINTEYGMELISVGMLPKDIFLLILDYYESRSCFYLISKDKYVFVFSENSEQITCFGKYKRQNNQNRNINHNFVQLFKLTPQFNEGNIIFKDNTGMQLESNEIVFQVVKWMLS